jgi:demethylspheroidene O-methyltransferase
MSWRKNWIVRRNAVFASAAFQRWAARFPLTRRVARKHASALFDLTAGFVYSQILAGFIASGLFDALRDGALDIDAAARATGLPTAATLTLLRAAEGLQLTESLDDRWFLGPRGAMLAGTRGITDMIAHHRLLYADLADPLAMLRHEGAGALAPLWSYADAVNPAAVAAYSGLMSATNAMVAEQALAAYEFGRHRRMLDVGGGEGRFVAAIAARYPTLQMGLFDRPAVVARAGAAGLTTYPGSFLIDDLPGGYDLITLVRVLHDHDDGPAAALLHKIRHALIPGGRLMIVEPLAGTRGATGVGAYFSFYLAAMRSGRPRSIEEIAAMAKAAGFQRTSECPTPQPMVARVILAEI